MSRCFNFSAGPAMLPTEVLQQAQSEMSAAKSRTQSEPSPLQASIRVVHGAEVLAENQESDTAMFEQFENQVNQRYH
jgi:phosphoserine aminotransferase